MKDLKHEIDEIYKFISSDFERKLFVNSLQKLDFIHDPTRYNSFAGTFRELIRHLLSSMAPDEEVKMCGWYKVFDKTKPKMITRAQRVQYIICKGLMDDFVENDLNFDLKRAISQTLNPIDTLNKYVHLDEYTYDIESSVGDLMVEECIIALYQFILSVNNFNSSLLNIYEDILYNHILELMMEETFNELDILSTHTRVEGISLGQIKILDINTEDIQIEISGQVEVKLQYGSDSENCNDECTYFDSYSFNTIEKYIPILNPLNVSIDCEDIIIDTSSFYD